MMKPEPQPDASLATISDDRARNRPGRGRILHAITGTGVGGAQAMLAKLLEVRGGAPFQEDVLSLLAPGDVAQRMHGAGAAIHTLGMAGPMPGPAALIRLVALSRSLAPDLIVGWMHHASLAAYLAARVHRPRPPVIWNVRHSLSDVAHEKLSTRLVLRQCARLSPKVDAIVFNSHVAQRQYAEFGYAVARSTVIPNGFDCSLFRPRDGARARLAEAFGLDPSRRVVGMIARNHPMKDPATLVAAMQSLWADGVDADLLIVGPDMDRLELPAGSDRGRIHLRGQRLDLPDWLPGLDLLVLPSAWGEAFPNTLGEAMACGVVCVATDVGDARWVVGDDRRIVPPGDPGSLARAIRDILDMPSAERRAIGLAGRAHVDANFSLPSVRRAYDALYEAVIDRADRPAAIRAGGGR